MPQQIRLSALDDNAAIETKLSRLGYRRTQDGSKITYVRRSREDYLGWLVVSLP